MWRLMISGVLFATCLAGVVPADDGFLEKFALAEDRAAVLNELIPGTEEYYYFHCLHYQNMQQYDEVDELLRAWSARHRKSVLINEIRYRQAMLTYELTPQRTLDFIRSQCGLSFNHQRDTPDAEPDLPEVLDQNLISRDRLLQQAFKDHNDLKGITDDAFRWLVSTELSPERRRHLLSRLDRPDYPGLVPLVVDDLKFRGSGGFGSHPIHQRLLLNQLQACARLMPSLLEKSAFVHAWLQRLAPGNDVNEAQIASERDAHLTRLLDFVRPLPPVHNSLKAHVLYQRLDFNRGRNDYDRELFLEYIRLPRRAPYMSSEFMKQPMSQQYPADLAADFTAFTRCPNIGNDEPLIRDYLHQFLIDADNTREFQSFLNDSYLTKRLAETKIVNGLGNPEQWSSLLAPDEYRRLRDRVDIDFAHTNQTHFGTDEAVSLDVFIKNVPTLIVKVFRINTGNFFRDFGREVNTDIDLDGLVANSEETFDYNVPPLRRVRQHFEFPELSGRGTYVIDFIGNGHSSRALIRRGQLRFAVTVTPGGQQFCIYDENGKPASSAVVTIGGQKYSANKDGKVTVPFSTDPGERVAVITSNGFSTMGRFQHTAENYELQAGILVDRQSLLRLRKAKVIVRPQLLLNGTPVSLSLLKDVRLTLTSVDHDEVSTTATVTDLVLAEDREAEHEFMVPDRLSSLTFSLSASVRNTSLAQDIPLSVTDTYGVNAIDRTEKIECVHLSKIDGRYIAHVRGRTGEPRKHRPVSFRIRHRDFAREVTATLRSDATGRIDLGALNDITSVTAKLASGVEQSWSLGRDQISQANVMHASTGSAVRIPCLLPDGPPARENIALCELRGNQFYADRFNAIQIEDGFAVLTDLSPGDYSLELRDSGQRVLIRVTDGGSLNHHLIGRSRVLEIPQLNPLQISAIQSDNGQLKISVRNASKFTRVHLFANQFAPAVSHFARLTQITAPGLTVKTQIDPLSVYAQGRQIGDEYRYILDRRMAEKFPGNMNSRPEILLNPWAVRSTQTERQDAAAGSDFAPQAPAPESSMSKERAALADAAPQGDFANLDFMAQEALVATNLAVDEDGTITIDLDLLGTHQHVHVVAVDPLHTVYRSYSLPDRSPRVLDQRLAETLPVEQHFSQQKHIDIVPAGAEFEISDVSTSRYQVYDNLTSVFQLYESLLNDPKLQEFRFILTWPELDQERKQQLYSKYACHELNFFLAQRDPDFFASVIKPWLANKLHKTFLDHWLLNEDLTPWLTPWRFERLNTVEQALLGRRIATERDIVSRYLRERLEVLGPDLQRVELLFGTALSGQVMSWDEAVAESLSFSDEVTEEPAVAGKAIMTPRGGAASVRRRNFGTERQLDDESEAKNEVSDIRLHQRFSLNELSRKRKLSESESLFDVDALGVLPSVLFRQTDTTQEWAENNYYQIPFTAQNGSLITVSSFWTDFSACDPEQPFFSSNLAEASRNFTEVMFAMALLDLPFQAGNHVQEQDDVVWKIKAASPLAIVHEQIRPTRDTVEDLPILVTQNFFRHNDRYRTVNGQRQDKFVSEEFLTHTVYGCQVVLTNPTSGNRRLNLLVQIPEGAIAVLGSHYTQSREVNVKPYETSASEYFFYFPLAGEFAHYPVNVAQGEQLVASVPPVTMNVVEQPTLQDTESWDFVSQFASGEEVINYLQTRSLYQTDLSRIAWRMQDAAFFSTVVELLTSHHAFDATLWSYGVRHNHRHAIREFLSHHEQFVQTCGPVLTSPLLTIEPVERNLYQHLEYRPLVNARAHQLGSSRRILNDRFRTQFADFMKLLTYQREISAEDRLTLTTYLLLQDRVAEALSCLARINAANIANQLQYDYLTAYCDFFDGEPDVARNVVKKYADYPVDRWRNTFAAMAIQIKDIDDSRKRGTAPETIDPDNRDQLIAQLAAGECTFEVAVDGGDIEVDFQNLETIQVNYYLMDIELLFSRNPFVQQHSGNFAHIHPNLSETYQLPAKKPRFKFELPEPLRNRNVLVEVVGQGKTRRAAYYSNSLALQMSDNYGQLRVTEQKGRQPLPGVYVKAYAKMKDGRTRFYKDGYTDLRGRFDYASLSTNDLDNVERFALLVMSDDQGALVREVAPPAR